MANSSLVCTYAVTGTTPVGQRLYECHTCGFTEANGSVICVTCAAVCHHDHHVVYKGYNASAYCDCGSSPKKTCKALTPQKPAAAAAGSDMKSGHYTPAPVGVNGQSSSGGASLAAATQQLSMTPTPVPQREFCTFATHGTNAVRFPNGLYECVTCVARLPVGSVVCPLCARVCHQGHVLRHLNKSVDATCDCGAEPKVCLCLPVKSTAAAAAPAVVAQPPLMYQPTMVYQPIAGTAPGPYSYQPSQAAPIPVAASGQYPVQQSMLAASAAQWAQSFLPAAAVDPNAAALAAAAADAPPPDFVEPPPEDTDTPTAPTPAAHKPAAASGAAANTNAVMEMALGVYTSVVSGAIEDGKVTPKDEKILEDLRKQYSISTLQHQQTLAKLNISDSKWTELKKKAATPPTSNGGSAAASAAGSGGGGGAGFGECVVCLSARSDHIILPCAHICLCGECSTKFKKDMPCPSCRQLIASIRKTFTS